MNTSILRTHLIANITMRFFKLHGWSIRHITINLVRCRSFSVKTGARFSFLCGQPIHATHPHLIGPNELTPGVSADEYASRCAQLAAVLPVHSLVVLIGARMAYKTSSSFYVFHQHPNFFYMTGINEPCAVFIMERDHSASGYKSYLFVRSKDPNDERWEGPRMGVEVARHLFCVDQVYDLNEADHFLSQCMRRASQIYADIPWKTGAVPAQHRSCASTILDKLCERLHSQSIQSIAPWIHRLREIKSPAELALMKQAASRSADVFNIIMQTPVETEALLWAKLSYELKIRNCEEAYVPVIGGGQNALIIHYTLNNMPLRKGDIVLVDAGGEYGNYVTDISRTWPVNGVFSPAQKDLYQAVLNVQKACIQFCSEAHAISLDVIHEYSVQLLKEELTQLGFDITYSDLRNILYPHYIGHQIGLEVHDCSELPRGVPLKENQTITIEPGIYVPDLPRFPKHFRGLGIRIEDSILIVLILDI